MAEQISVVALALSIVALAVSIGVYIFVCRVNNP
jgi:hypothetical protein